VLGNNTCVGLLNAWVGIGFGAQMTLRRHRAIELPPDWVVPQYREIQRRIGERLRRYFELPKELPDRLLTLLTRLTEVEDEQ
jgi:hypothetical protein